MKKFLFVSSFILAAVMLFVGVGVAHASVCVNCASSDKPTLQMRNIPGGWTTGTLNANPGDTLGFLVYYRNSGTTAGLDGKVQVIVPHDFVNSPISVTGQVLTSNGAPSAGYGTVNVSGSASVQVQINSQARLYKNSDTNYTLVPVTITQSGSNTIASVDVGTLQAQCSDQTQIYFFANLVAGQVTPTPTPTITPTPTVTPGVSYVNISKTVRDVNSNTGFQKSVNANQGDQVQYSISVTAGGTTSTMGDVLVVDTLPSFVTLVSGTVRVDNQYAADNWLFTSGLDIGTMYPGQMRTIQFTATVATGIPQGTQTLTNWAKAWSTTGNIVQDSAMVFVNGYYNPTSILSLTKQSRDLTITTSNTYYNDLYTVPGRDIEFQLVVSNVGNTTATNVMLQDALPSGMTYDQNSTTIDGNFTSDGITGSGINLGTMYQGQTHTVKFRALVQPASYFTQNTTQLVNTAYTRADNVSQIQATANVWVVKSGRVLGASTVDTGVDLAGLVTLGSTGFGSVVLGAYQVARKRLLRSKIMALRQIGTV